MKYVHVKTVHVEIVHAGIDNSNICSIGAIILINAKTANGLKNKVHQRAPYFFR